MDYYDRQGKPITMEKWGELKFGGGTKEAREAACRVAKTDLGDIWVSTVWLGLDHNYFGGGPPLIFETMVFGGPMDGELRRYSTEEGAQKGHDEVVALVLADAEF